MKEVTAQFCNQFHNNVTKRVTEYTQLKYQHTGINTIITPEEVTILIIKEIDFCNSNDFAFGNYITTNEPTI
jgi:hypothetical protein